MKLFYLPSSGQVLNSDELPFLTGFSANSDPGYLAANGIYTVIPSDDPYDAYLYATAPAYTVAGDYANQTWVATPRSLTTAKQGGTTQAKQAANQEESFIIGESGLSTDLLTAVSSQDPLARPARFQTVLDGMTAVSDQLDSNLTAIDAATTVDEINNIVNPPTGVIHIGRTGEDLDPTTYVSFNSVTLTEADTELYIPGTSTVVVYGFYVPGEFDTPPGAFNVGDYLIQIREVATSRVIAEFECPSGYADVTF